MSPDFLPDDFILVCRHPWQRWAVGMDIVIDHAQYGVIIKRISDIGHAGVSVYGLHPASTSSTALGFIPFSAILGKVYWHSKKPR